MEQEPRTLWDYGLKRTRQPPPLLPTPVIQAPPHSPFASCHGPREKESDQKRFLSPTHPLAGFPVLLL